MKKLIVGLLFIIAFCTVNGQVKQDGNGNFYATQKTETEAKLTGKTFTDSKGIVYPVYVSSRGKYFVVKTSKTGKKYNYYLKVD